MDWVIRKRISKFVVVILSLFFVALKNKLSNFSTQINEWIRLSNCISRRTTPGEGKLGILSWFGGSNQEQVIHGQTGWRVC